MPLTLTSTAIAGLLVAETTAIVDARGSFARLYCQNELAQAIGPRQIVQINQSRTTTIGAIRGLHFQHAPHAEMKLVRCLSGRVYDVAVDLREGSPTRFAWHAEELSAANRRMMIIPEGFAHGFQVIEADSQLLYLHTHPYVPESEAGVRHDDPRLAIAWPLPVTDLSARDRSHPLLPQGGA